MDTRVQWIGLVTAALLVPAHAAPECRALRDRRDQLSRAAMQAEIVLVQATRRQICPAQELLAEQANAGEPPGAEQLDFSAYIRCRRQAEAHLQRTRPILYRNQRAFPYYTAEGARLVADADTLQEQVDRHCRETPQAGGAGRSDAPPCCELFSNVAWGLRQAQSAEVPSPMEVSWIPYPAPPGTSCPWRPIRHAAPAMAIRPPHHLKPAGWFRWRSPRSPAWWRPS
jgi:hypothetical protein